MSAFTDILRDMREHSSSMPAGELVRLLADKSGLLNDLRNQSKDETGFQRRKRNLDELAESGSKVVRAAPAPAIWLRSWRCCRATTRTMAATRCA
ncbi:hypothetical protein MP631_03010 [Xanthomonas phaseoli pv. phaseoli]|nr:hypothetical protein MP631_03010 [Xanthomonas phaseoli pv. phaseoli]